MKQWAINLCLCNVALDKGVHCVLMCFGLLMSFSVISSLAEGSLTFGFCSPQICWFDRVPTISSLHVWMHSCTDKEAKPPAFTQASECTGTDINTRVWAVHPVYRSPFSDFLDYRYKFTQASEHMSKHGFTQVQIKPHGHTHTHSIQLSPHWRQDLCERPTSKTKNVVLYLKDASVLLGLMWNPIQQKWELT